MLPLTQLVERLASHYGEPEKAPRRTLFELVLFENVAYLVDDDARLRAFEALRANVGLEPEQILAASGADLLAASGAGILASNQVDKLRRIAQLALDAFDGDLERLRHLPLRDARKALMRFPSIGEPGAEKILLFGRSHVVLGLESNGVRVLTRVGLVAEARSYAATYRQVQQVVAPEAERGFDWLLRAHQLLRQHGQSLCRRTRPACEQCPLNDACDFFASPT
jgi:endonuclease III